ncbi:MAG: hypothetical protein QI223_01120 [Candidatus Korarchaeota archaeon]|nr:hypothetical protein [Candidatus Korarchaeota archaeon]
MNEAVIELIKDRLREIAERLRELKSRIQYFERKHAMPSREFLTRYRSGELGDDQDFMEWEACLTLVEELDRERKALRGALE